MNVVAATYGNTMEQVRQSALPWAKGFVNTCDTRRRVEAEIEFLLERPDLTPPEMLDLKNMRKYSAYLLRSLDVCLANLSKHASRLDQLSKMVDNNEAG